MKIMGTYAGAVQVDAIPLDFFLDNVGARTRLLVIKKCTK